MVYTIERNSEVGRRRVVMDYVCSGEGEALDSSDMYKEVAGYGCQVTFVTSQIGGAACSCMAPLIAGTQHVVVTDPSNRSHRCGVNPALVFRTVLMSPVC